MAKGWIWATAEGLARKRGQVMSLYCQILRSLNCPNLPLNMAARLSKKADDLVIFMLASEERSLHNVDDLIDTREYIVSLLSKGRNNVAMEDVKGYWLRRQSKDDPMTMGNRQ